MTDYPLSGNVPKVSENDRLEIGCEDLLESLSDSNNASTPDSEEPEGAE